MPGMDFHGIRLSNHFANFGLLYEALAHSGPHVSGERDVPTFVHPSSPVSRLGVHSEWLEHFGQGADIVTGFLCPLGFGNVFKQRLLDR